MNKLIIKFAIHGEVEVEVPGKHSHVDNVVEAVQHLKESMEKLREQASASCVVELPEAKVTL